MKPLIRWAGSKRKLLPYLKTFWNGTFTRYVEPFAGSACLFFDLEPDVAMLGDTNRELVATYKAIRSDPEAVYDILRQIPSNKSSYYAFREQAPTDKHGFLAAARFIYLNRFCFNGIYRTNMAGKFNVPFSGEGTGAIPDLKHLQNVSRQLQKAKIYGSDFENILDKTVEGDFVYLDPPYSVENRRVFKQYGPSIFGLEDLDRLSKQLFALDKKRVKFVVSYAYCREALEKFGSWMVTRKLTTRNISGFAEHRKKAVELMFTNILT